MARTRYKPIGVSEVTILLVASGVWRPKDRSR